MCRNQDLAQLLISNWIRSCRKSNPLIVGYRVAESQHLKLVIQTASALAGAGELAAQRSTDAWSIKAHSETIARQQELVAHYTAVSHSALPEVCSSTSLQRRDALC